MHALARALPAAPCLARLDVSRNELTVEASEPDDAAALTRLRCAWVECRKDEVGLRLGGSICASESRACPE